MMIPTTLDRKKMKKWLKNSVLATVLALLLVIASLPVYAGEQQTEQTETPTVTQDTGSESAQSAASSENDEIIADELEPMQPIAPQEPEVAAMTDWTQEQPHEGQVLHGGYVGFKNKASGKYMTIPGGATAAGTNVCQQSGGSVANAQEFYLSYTYDTEYKRIAYFTIYPVNANGNAASTRVKSDLINTNTGVANVSLQFFMPTQMTDRWQIEHYEDNYYIIHIASTPYESGSRYVLTAQLGEGSANGSGIYDPGNVFVTTLAENNTPSDSMLWQICADGNPVNINGLNIATVSNSYISLGETVEFYYIPPRFNIMIEWQGRDGAIVDNGIATRSEYGVGTILMNVIDPSTGLVDLDLSKTSEITVMPSEGLYFISNASTIDYLGSTLTISSIVPLQIAAVASASLFYWDIQHDETLLGYFTIRSVNNGLYLNVDPSNSANVQLSYANGGNTLWKVESGNLGNAVLRCRNSTASNDTLVLSVGNGEESLNMASYVSDTQYYDEWDLYPYEFDYSVYHYYDSGFDVRFPEDDNEIAEYQTVCTNVLLAIFGVHTYFQIYDYYSCADNCSGLPITLAKTESVCDCSGSIDHKIRAQLRIDLIEQFGAGDAKKSRIAWTGHYLEDGRSDSSSASHTVVMAVKEENNNSGRSIRSLYVYSLLHEISHQLGAPDHYCYSSGTGGSYPCDNENCFNCQQGCPPPICLMSGFSFVENSMENHTTDSLYCDQCKSLLHSQGIGTHLLDHH